MLILAPLIYWPPSKDHDALVRGREDLEKQLSEQKVAVEQQRKRYKEMEVCGVGGCVCEGGGGWIKLGLVSVTNLPMCYSPRI